jgi:Chaperone of endosialidase
MVPGFAWNWIAVNAVNKSASTKAMKTKTMKTLDLRNLIGRSPLRLGLPRVQRIWIIRGFLLIPLVLACFALSPTARALLPPPAPDGGYLNNNTAEGNGSLFSLTTGIHNSAVGFQALHDNTSGGFNTATGFKALVSNTTGSNNTAVGDVALAHNETGHDNTATGFEALFFNDGQFNTATGDQALYNGQSGSSNTATGFQALYNGYGMNNTATGVQALYSDTSGGFNAATGVQALYSNTTGDENTANGANALFYNTTGTHNTATGVEALLSNITGVGNTASGFQALHNNRGSFNIGLGNQAGINLTTGNRNIDIGNGGVAGETNTIRIGNIQTATYIVGISGSTATGGAAVFVASNGKLGTVTSSRRFKKDIADMNAASEALLALRPVTFRYKPELDKAGIPQYGLVAEEVAEVNPDLVVRDENGEIYEAVNAMLLNEFLKEHQTVQQQGANIARLEKQIEALTAGLQRVSAQLELSKSAQQVVNNNQ